MKRTVVAMAIPRLVKVFQCPTCTWFRCLSENKDLRERYYSHPIYGRVTGERMAELDILKHKCYTHNITLARMGHVPDPDADFSDVIDLDKELSFGNWE